MRILQTTFKNNSERKQKHPAPSEKKLHSTTHFASKARENAVKIYLKFFSSIKIIIVDINT
jgi:hypothetical protein